MGIDPQYGQSGFVKTDDNVTLYWRTVGQGPPLVCCNGVGVSTFFWKYLVAHFSPTNTVIVWDYRGHGRSQRSIDPEDADMRIERHADDLSAVLNDVAKTLDIEKPPPALRVSHYLP